MEKNTTEFYPKQIIYGDVPSKSNSYKIITIAGHSSLGKSKKLKEYENKFFLQCTLRGKEINSNFRITLDCFFGSNRKDLDGCFKIILDSLQACKAIKNDRLCAEIHARKFIDKENPRITFKIEKLI